MNRNLLGILLTLAVLSLLAPAASAKDKVNVMVSFADDGARGLGKGVALFSGADVRYDWPELNIIAIRDLPAGEVGSQLCQG